MRSPSPAGRRPVAAAYIETAEPMALKSPLSFAARASALLGGSVHMT